MKERGVAQQFSIKDLERFTNVKSHTIRMWEQRYGLLQPLRTATNIRYYSGEDLKKLLNVSFLLDQGFKISKVAEMSNQDLILAVEEIQMKEGGVGSVFNQLKISMLQYNEELFKKISDDWTAAHGFEQTVTQIYLPFLSQIGALWLTNAICPAQEHFISHLMRQEMNVAMSALESPPQNDMAHTVVLFLPEREIHDISLLFLHFLIKRHGFKSIFLGASVPFEDLIGVSEQFPKATFVSYCTTHPAPSEAQEYVDMITSEFANSGNHFVLGGRVFEGVRPSSIVKTATNGGELAAVLFS